ncbi:MAG: ATP-binding cassette domain-containing protein, partial [Chlamydiae bacterium]|nr:ATP-binding cassette domain-containing protein [Chlamydiota bacterium]
MQEAVFCEGLNVSYETNPVLWEVSCLIPQGKLAAILGPNGAGKSTLLKTLVDIIAPTSGSALCFGEPFKRVRKRVAYVPQKESVDWEFPITVSEVVLMGRYAGLGFFKWARKADYEAARRALQALGIEHLADRQIGELSGGQKQR